MSERTKAILHRLLAGAVILGAIVAIWSFVSGCSAQTRVRYDPVTGVIEYDSAKDVTGLYFEQTEQGMILQVDEATGSRQADAQAALMLELIKRIPGP